MKGVILSLCDRTGNWSRPYLEAGYRVVRVEIEEGQDVRLMKRLDEPIRGILAAPPCTHFAIAGARWWKDKGDAELLEGLSVIDACLRAVIVHRPDWWVLENPVGRLKSYLGPPAFKFQPCDFGDPYTKRTYLWGHFTPPVPMFCPSAVSVAPTLGSVTNRMSSRNKVGRSTTPMGFARAFFEANP